VVGLGSVYANSVIEKASFNGNTLIFFIHPIGVVVNIEILEEYGIALQQLRYGRLLTKGGRYREGKGKQE
jgi:hypothetical protein